MEGERIVGIIDIIMIFSICACFLFAFSKRLKKVMTNNSLIHSVESCLTSIIKQYYWLFFSCILIIAVTVRAWKFGSIPHGFNQDEAMAALEGLSLLNNGTDHYGMPYPVYFTAWITSQMNVLLSYILVPFFKFFGPSIFVARLPLLIFSLISLYVIFKFSYRLFGKFEALAILFVVAINPWHIMISRWALEANLFPHFLLYGCYLIYLGLEKKKYIYCSMVIFGIAMYSYGISYYLVPILLITLCVYMLHIKCVKWYDVVACVCIYTAIAWPLFAMMGINLFKFDTVKLPFMTIPFFEKGERMHDILFFSDGILGQLCRNFLCVICIIFFQVEDSPWNSIPGIGPLYYITLPFLILGIALFIDKLRNRESQRRNGIFVISSFFAAAFVSGLITNNANLNRLNAFLYPILFIVGYAVYQVVHHLKVTIISILLVFVVSFSSFSYSYFWGDFSDKLGKEFYCGFIESLNYVRECDYDKLYITAKTQGSDGKFTSEILTQFLLELDVGYITGETLPDGELLEYKEKYHYGIDSCQIDEGDINTVYIVHSDETVYFDMQEFDFIHFDDYCVVMHRVSDGLD